MGWRSPPYPRLSGRAVVLSFPNPPLYLSMRTLPSLRRITQGAAAACAFGLVGAPLTAAQDASRAALQSFDRVDDVAWSDARNVPVFLSGDLRAASSAQPEAIAEAFLDEQTALLRAAGPVDFAVTRVMQDELGTRHVRVMQEVSGVPVFGAESIVHIGRQGQVYAFGGDVHPAAAAVDTKPSLSAQAALAIAKGWLPAGAKLAVDAVAMPEDGPVAAPTAIAPTARLVIYPESEDAYRLAYHADLQTAAPEMARWQVFVDAKTGEVFHHFNAIHTHTSLDEPAHYEAVNLEAAPAAPMASAAAVQASVGSGNSLYRGSVSLNTYLSSNTYYLYDVTRGPSYIRTMRATNNGTGTPGNYITDTGNTFTDANQRAAVDVHWGVAQVYDYFKNTHGRNSYDGNNASITSTINVVFYTGSGYSPNNASWNGSQMSYGDGDGSTFGPLVDLDITAHELTHAVTQYTANLIYQNESGALNEAMSDIFAAMVDRNDWTVGEDSYTPGTSGDALRSLSNPPAGDQPDNYAARYTGTGDNGGVHINSGIFNKAAYLMAAGGTFRGVTTASIGREKTERIWYRALANYFTQSTGYSGARSGVLSATADLYGSGGAEYAAAQNAFAAVGIGSAAGGGGGGTPPPSGGTPTWRYETISKQTPHPYANNWNNTYTYTKTGAQRIALYFEQFELENNYDFVYIKDRSNATKATYTGTKSAFWAIVDGDQIKANTVTDYSVTDYGWRITRAAYYSDRNLLVADEDTNPVLGFVPEAAASDEVMLTGSKNVPAELALTGVYPNPTSGAATVAYALPQTADVELAAYDVLGRRVAVLASGSVEAGTHEASFDASALPAGLYVVRLRAGDQVLTQRVTVTR